MTKLDRSGILVWQALGGLLILVGGVRYSSGTMPTSYGYTGQRGDPSGLTYMHARYYDGSVGAFISADTVQGPNRYGYVGGNPATNTDPTGQRYCTNGNPKCMPGVTGDGACNGNCAYTNPCAVNPDGAGCQGIACGSYTKQQCDQARQAQAAEVQNKRFRAGVYQLVAGIGGYIADAFLLSTDINSKPDPDKVLNIATDIASLIADYGVYLEGLGNIMPGLGLQSDYSDSLRSIGGEIGQFGLALKAALNIFRAAPGFWIAAAKWTLALVIFGLSTLGGALTSLPDLLASLGLTIVKLAKPSFVGGINAIVSFAQIWALSQGAVADAYAEETPFGFCTSQHATSGCPS